MKTIQKRIADLELAERRVNPEPVEVNAIVIGSDRSPLWNETEHPSEIDGVKILWYDTRKGRYETRE
jgi:hypothetical protein